LRYVYRIHNFSIYVLLLILHPQSLLSLSATAGSAEVTVSHDLRGYLTVPHIARCTTSRSDCLYFDWTAVKREREGEGEGAAPVGSCGKSAAEDVTETGSEHIVETIFSRSVILSKPYTGPTVKHGQPMVYLRTRLVPVGTFIAAPLNTSGDRVTGYEDINRGEETDILGEEERLVREYEVPLSLQSQEQEYGYLHGFGYGKGPGHGEPAVTAVTAVCAHPLLPHVILGFQDDSLSIMECTG
jgi:hypothetical protein